MKLTLFVRAIAGCALAAPLAAQTTTTPPAVEPTPMASPTPSAPADAAPALTDAEQATLKKCQAMTPAQQGQSSKCSKVMVKAGKEDPAKARAPETAPM